MSFVTTLEPGPRPSWADYARDEFSSMQELCAEVAWKRPAKVIAPDSNTLREFLTECDDEHGFEPSQFWMIKVGNVVLEHPTWKELELKFKCEPSCVDVQEDLNFTFDKATKAALRDYWTFK